MKGATNSIKPASQTLRQQARQHWGRITRPLRSLGVLKEDTIRIAATSDNLTVSLRLRVTVVMYEDNGVIKEGVTQAGQEVTATVVGNVARGSSCICLMARQAEAGAIPVDVGMACRDVIPGVVNRKVAYGTKNFLERPVTTMEETVKAMEAGADMAMELKERGYMLAGSGEMGVGNTTTNSALLFVLPNMGPRLVAGRGAGLATVGYNRKVQVIRGGIRIRKPSERDPVDILPKVGGLDLMTLTGFYTGCAVCGLPVVLDGLITGAVALAVVRINPDVKGYLLASHVSAEPIGAMVLGVFGLKPATFAGMCLEEDTGAAVLSPLLDMAATVHTQMNSFDDIHVDAYEYLLWLGCKEFG